MFCPAAQTGRTVRDPSPSLSSYRRSEGLWQEFCLSNSVPAESQMLVSGSRYLMQFRHRRCRYARWLTQFTSNAVGAT